MNDPAKQKEPENPRQHELHHGLEQASLNELPEAWDEEAAKRSDHVAGRPLSSHCALRIEVNGRLPDGLHGHYGSLAPRVQRAVVAGSPGVGGRVGVSAVSAVLEAR